MTSNANSVNIKNAAAGSGVGAPSTDRRGQRYHHGDLREALIAAGLAQLETRGLDTLSLREMARTAGVSATAVYRHFPDKAAVLQALAYHGITQLGDRQRIATETAGGGRAGFVASGMAYIRFAVERPALFRLAISQPTALDQLTAAPEQIVPAMRQLRATVSELFPSAQDDEQRRAAALHAWALVHGLSQLILDGAIAWEPERIEPVLNHLGTEVS